jgi:hypothetical protein
MPDDKTKRGRTGGKAGGDGRKAAPDTGTARGKAAGEAGGKAAREPRAASASRPRPVASAPPAASGETYDVAGLASKHGLSLTDAMGLIRKNGNDRAVLDRAAEVFKKANRRYKQ